MVYCFIWVRAELANWFSLWTKSHGMCYCLKQKMIVSFFLSNRFIASFLFGVVIFFFKIFLPVLPIALVFIHFSFMLLFAILCSMFIEVGLLICRGVESFLV